jgi:hypothetical protein
VQPDYGGMHQELAVERLNARPFEKLPGSRTSAFPHSG